MAKIADTHSKKKNLVQMRKMTNEAADRELREVHRKIIQAYEMSGMNEKDREEIIDRLFTQKRELLSIIKENEIDG